MYVNMNNIAESESTQQPENQSESTDQDSLAQNTTDTSKPVEKSDEQPAEESMENLMDLYEESFKRFEEGEVVTGRIISVDKDHVLVDIGYKSEGLIPISQFLGEDGKLTVEVGDEVDVFIENTEDYEGSRDRRL